MATSGVRFSLDFIVLLCVCERRRPPSSTHNSDSCEYINIVAQRSFCFTVSPSLYTVCAVYRIGEAYGAHFTVDPIASCLRDEIGPPGPETKIPRLHRNMSSLATAAIVYTQKSGVSQRSFLST
jgi:hypothetical protein